MRIVFNNNIYTDFFYKVVEGLVPAMPPVHFLTQQRPWRLVCSCPYNKDSSIDFFCKVVEGLVPAMPPEHFLTQQRPWRLICSRPIGSAFSPSRLKMQ